MVNFNTIGNTPPPATQEQVGSPEDQELLRRKEEFFEFFEKAMEEEGDFYETKAKFREKSQGLWSREFVDEINSKIQEYDDEGAIDASFILNIGAPNDFAIELIADGSYEPEDLKYSFKDSPGLFGDLFQAMANTEEGLKKFKETFVGDNPWMAEELVNKHLENIDDSEHSDARLRDLAVAKGLGVNLLNETFPKLEKKEQKKAGRNVALFLSENGLLDEKDIVTVYEKILSIAHENEYTGGILDVAIEKGVQIETDNPDIQYWSELSLQEGKDMLGDFLRTPSYDSEGAKHIQETFDFTKEPIMRLFVRRTVYPISFQTPQFREALRQPAFQDIIMQAIEDKQNEDRPLQETPDIFLMLAQDPAILQDMLARGAFDGYPESKKLEAIGKISSGDYDERYRLGLFIGEEFNDDTFYDENGNPNYNFANKYFDYNDNHYFFTTEQMTGFGQELLEHSEYSLLSRKDPETMASMGFDGATIAFLNFYNDNGLPQFGIQPNELHAFFDGNGPKPELWQKCLAESEFDYLSRLSDELLAEGFNETTIAFLKFYKGHKPPFEINYDEIHLYFDENGPKPEFWQKCLDEGDFNYILKQNPETMASMGFDENIMELLHRCAYSNADEILNFKDKIAGQLLSQNLSGEEMLQKFESIEDIFLKNNLPYVGKAFCVFQILYPPEKYEDEGNITNKGVLAKYPGQIDENSYSKESDGDNYSKEIIIWHDLLKATIGSNSRDFRQYLDDLANPDHLRTIIATLDGHVSGASELLSPTERHSMEDRIVRMFAYPLGYTTFEELRNAVYEIPKQADQRNRERLRKHDFSLQKGDLVKSTATEYLGFILQNGAICKEFLGADAGSDSTPLDADVGIFEQDFESISDAIEHKNRTNAFGAMHCILVMKGDESSGRNRFQHMGDGDWNPNKYEIWDNSGENHGIRVGFPSSEIDFIVFDDKGKVDSYGNLNQIKIEIAKNGFFIPVVDKHTGESVFSEEEYETLRRKMSGLEHYDGGEFQAASDEFLHPESTTIGGVEIPSVDELVAELKNNRSEVDKKREAIIDQVIKPSLGQFGLEHKPVIDGDLTPGSAEVIDTGSTGRYSNAPGDGDFDFMIKLDRNIFIDSAQISEIRKAFGEHLGADATTTGSGDFRAKGVALDGLEAPVDIDITFAHRTNRIEYTTDVALQDYYDSMTPEERELITANVVFAKKILKAAGAYKSYKAREAQGGLGGVGVENWVLQNGGSFILAAREFMAVADECGDDFEKFKSKYAVFDFGQNHRSKGRDDDYDNFVVNNMNATGYRKMRQVLSEYLTSIGQG